jgi:hypothetical protein
MTNLLLQKDIIIKSIKLIDIGYIIVLDFLAGYYSATLLDHLFLKLFGDHNLNKNKFRVLFEILVQVMITAIIAYILRNLIEYVPFPLNGISGYNHMRVKELKDGPILLFFIFLFQYKLQEKVEYLGKITYF